jgi:excisionase family DNA binding protein
MDSCTCLVDTKAVATWLGVSRRTVRLWAECSELPGIKVGRQWRFKREAIIAWLDEAEKKVSNVNSHCPSAASTAGAAYSFSLPRV